jgi:hypothetical protein
VVAVGWWRRTASFPANRRPRRAFKGRGLPLGAYSCFKTVPFMTKLPSDGGWCSTPSHWEPRTRHRFVYNESLELTAAQHTAVKI